jgi:hypothetical protein
MDNMFGMSARIARAVIVIAYGTAVMTLAWATVSNYLGEQIYGRITMTIMALPFSIVDWLVGAAVFNVLRGGPTYASGWDLAAMAWPGIAMAIVLAVLMMRKDPWAGFGVGWLLASATSFCGILTLINSWGPRRPWGWPFLACGLIMMIGLIAAQRRQSRLERAE